MSNVKPSLQRRAAAPVFGSFYPLQTLWDPDSERPLFHSENSARWFIRNHKQDLVNAKAIAIHAGRLFVDPSLCASVAQEIALNAAAATA